MLASDSALMKTAHVQGIICMSVAFLFFVVGPQCLLAAVTRWNLGRFQQLKVFANDNLCGSGVTWKEPLQHTGAMGQ